MNENLFILNTKHKRPVSRCYHSSFIYDNHLYIFGGYDSILGEINDFWKINLNNFDDKDWKWEKIDIYFKKIKNFKCRSFLVDNMAYLVNNNLQNKNMDFLQINLDSYENEILNNTLDFCLELFTLNKINDNNLIFYGGFDNNKNCYISNICLVEFKNGKFYQIEELKPINKDDIWPEKRGCHNSVIINNNLIIYGGYNIDKIFSDIWEFNIEKKYWSKIIMKKKLKPRYNYGIILLNNEIFIFGGSENISKEHGDIIKINIFEKTFTYLIESNTNDLKEKQFLINKQIKSIKIKNKNTLNKELFINTQLNINKRTNLCENKYKKDLKKKEALLKEFNPDYSLESFTPQYKIINEFKSKFLNNDIKTSYKKTTLYSIDSMSFDYFKNNNGIEYLIIFGGDRNGVSNNKFTFILMN